MTKKQQMTVWTPEGLMTLTQASKRSGLPEHVIENRVNAGWRDTAILAPRGCLNEEAAPCR